VNQDGAQTSNPVPAITTLLPTGATAGSGALTLTVNGSGFVNGAVVNFGGNARTTNFVSANQLTAAILASDIASVGTPAVTVTNPSPGGGTSNSLTFNVTAANTATITVGTTPAGLSFSVDGTSYTTSQTLTWVIGSSHTLTTAAQSGAEWDRFMGCFAALSMTP